MANPYGDVELDARGMRALAHPVRLAILTRLQSDGPSTATRLSESVGASPSVTSWHLRQLAVHGLVRDASDAQARRDHGRERWWEAVSRGFRFAGSRRTTRSRRPGRSSRSWRAWTATSSAAGAPRTSLVWSRSG